ncbi:uncharacterized protein LOC116356632 [Oncorhynchus kisutch]|uniref:uncharacterized protein LOC116356632 n=1 Tax=Oncorhynchus kisutch TaxID=8019 RepID=UPI0012DD732A|nr:uncharacterized protein LOC116356632 [Oncorhynchus kisutch]
MVNYLMTNKKLPAELPQAVNQQSRDGKISSGFPKHLIPKEARCKECDYVLSDPLLITAKGRILTTTGVVEGISTYRRSCLNCGVIYRYQELEDGVHNFDDHIILSLHLCLMIRNALQEADVLLRDTLEAARWCERQTFKGTVSLPSVIGMDGEDRITTLKELRCREDEEENILLKEPFMFPFQLQRDYEKFCVEAVDKKKMTVFTS